MAKPAKSQWEFGELFPVEAVRRVLTVSELTGSIRRALEKEVGTVSVMGEITNLRLQPSGHVYFTIKDANSQIACVLFRNDARAVNREFLNDGQKVVIDGEITVYEARGQYQLRVLGVQLQGVGALQVAFEKLKQKLQTEGLFDSAHKRPLPRFPRRIGIVTSPIGAAIEDVIHAIERRDPSLEIVLAPVRVQGQGAGQEIAAAINALNEWTFSNGEPSLDLILVTRGGGSLEDLWAFNEEIVARAIYSSKLPVISGVGHEIDFTISDFVADVRAATPTAAAEIITEGVFAARPYIAQIGEQVRHILVDALAAKREELSSAVQRLQRLHPKRRLREQAQRLDELHASINRCVRTHLRQKQSAFKNTENRLARLHPETGLARWREALTRLSAKLCAHGKAKAAEKRHRFSNATARLALLSPEQTLRRGYSITTDSNGKVLRNTATLKPGDELRTRLADGEITSRITAD
ncbi:MAG TPA: exodeoxyribonuclease VII large subunit [Verrucomicrobiae bacterium]